MQDQETDYSEITDHLIENGAVAKEFSDGTYLEITGKGRLARTLRIGFEEDTVTIFVLDHTLALLGSSTLTGWMARPSAVEAILRDAI